jgi:hypothetical protein
MGDVIAVAVAVLKWLIISVHSPSVHVQQRMAVKIRPANYRPESFANKDGIDDVNWHSLVHPWGAPLPKLLGNYPNAQERLRGLVHALKQILLRMGFRQVRPSIKVKSDLDSKQLRLTSDFQRSKRILRIFNYCSI